MARWKGTDSAETHFGGGARDTFKGAGGDDTLNGYGGDDYLDGGAGNDQIAGGAGEDTLVGGTGNDYLSDFVPGSNGTLLGGAGDDTIGACAGNDLLDGGDGNDWLILALNAGPLVIDLQHGTIPQDGFGGIDTVKSVENILYGIAGADLIHGSDGVNSLPVGDRDTVYGAGGDDILRVAGLDHGFVDGGKGQDTAVFGDGYYTMYGAFVVPDQGIRVSLGNDRVSNDGFGHAGTITTVENVAGGYLDDRIVGDAHANILSGNMGADTLSGGSGDDVLIGSYGRDVMTGGRGADRFAFDTVSDSGKSGQAADRIVDFDSAQHDKIDLSAIDANVYTGSNDAFTFIGTAAFDGIAGEVRYKFSGGDTYVQIATASFGTDLVIKIDGIHDLVQGDFVL